MAHRRRQSVDELLNPLQMFNRGHLDGDGEDRRRTTAGLELEA